MTRARRSEAPGERRFAVGDTCGKYRIMALLGEGGMGEVYEAEADYPKRRVALKVVRLDHPGAPAFAAGQQKEAQLLAELDHPNIVRLYDAGVTEDGVVYLVMERVVGRTLRYLLHWWGRMELFAALVYGLQIADALRVAHHGGIVHRDLKPENVIVRREALLKVVDFGIARRVRAAGQAVSTDRFANVLTPLYSSPEQARSRDAGTPSDVYALGLMLWEMVIGRHPFVSPSGERPTLEQALMNHIAAEVPPLRELGAAAKAPGLSDLVERMLAKAPDDRPSAGQVYDALFDAAQRYEAEHPGSMARLARNAGRPRNDEDDGDGEDEDEEGSAAPARRRVPVGPWALLGRAPAGARGLPHATALLPADYRPLGEVLPFGLKPAGSTAPYPRGPEGESAPRVVFGPAPPLPKVAPAASESAPVARTLRTAVPAPARADAPFGARRGIELAVAAALGALLALGGGALLLVGLGLSGGRAAPEAPPSEPAPAIEVPRASGGDGGPVNVEPQPASSERRPPPGVEVTTTAPGPAASATTTAPGLEPAAAAKPVSSRPGPRWPPPAKSTTPPAGTAAGAPRPPAKPVAAPAPRPPPPPPPAAAPTATGGEPKAPPRPF